MNSLNDIFISENIHNLFNGNKLNVEFIKQQYKNKTLQKLEDEILNAFLKYHNIRISKYGIIENMNTFLKFVFREELKKIEKNDLNIYLIDKVINIDYINTINTLFKLLSNSFVSICDVANCFKLNDCIWVVNMYHLIELIKFSNKSKNIPNNLISLLEDNNIIIKYTDNDYIITDELYDILKFNKYELDDQIKQLQELDKHVMEINKISTELLNKLEKLYQIETDKLKIETNNEVDKSGSETLENDKSGSETNKEIDKSGNENKNETVEEVDKSENKNNNKTIEEYLKQYEKEFTTDEATNKYLVLTKLTKHINNYLKLNNINKTVSSQKVKKIISNSIEKVENKFKISDINLFYEILVHEFDNK